MPRRPQAGGRMSPRLPSLLPTHGQIVQQIQTCRNDTLCVLFLTYQRLAAFFDAANEMLYIYLAAHVRGKINSRTKDEDRARRRRELVGPGRKRQKSCRPIPNRGRSREEETRVGRKAGAKADANTEALLTAKSRGGNATPALPPKNRPQRDSVRSALYRRPCRPSRPGGIKKPIPRRKRLRVGRLERS